MYQKHKRNSSEVGGFPPSFPPPYFKIFLTVLLITVATIVHYSTREPTFVMQEPTIGSVQITIDNRVYDYDFEEEGSFIELLSKHHTVVVSRGILLSIDQVETDFKNDYIAIYFNEKYSQFGILDLPLCDGCTYEFIKKQIN